jgi:hypothetical protein
MATAAAGRRTRAQEEPKRKGRPRSQDEPHARREWVLARAAARLIGCDEATVRKLAAAGLIARRAIPGTLPRYNLSDITKMVDRYTVPARAEAK